MSAFFESRPVLQHIHDYARARMVSPWATLGVVLARAATATPPDVQLPPLTGGPQSLNLFMALVGQPGQGKGAAESAGRAAVQFVNNDGREPRTLELAVGSGEGIARTFRPRGTDDDEPNPEHAALFSVPEVDTLAAIGKRQGSTLLSQVRSVYSGERLGFANAGADTRVMVEPHSYRACLVVGVQPAKSGHLLNDADGGTPQRFVWLPTTDTKAPDEPPVCPEPVTVRACRWGPGVTLLPIAETAENEIRAQRLAALRGAADADPLEGHALLTRLKVAAALMLLDGRGRVNEEDWQLAGHVMAVSRATRESCQRDIRAKAKAASQAKAYAKEEQEDETYRLRLEKAVAYVVRKIESKGGACTRRDLSQGAPRLRDYIDAAIDNLETHGRIVVEKDEEKTTYSLPERSTGQRVNTGKAQVEALTKNSVDPVDQTKPQVRAVDPVDRVERTRTPEWSHL